MNKFCKSVKIHLNILTLAILLLFNFQAHPQKRYWHENLPLTSFRLPPPPLDAEIKYIDLDKDGDPDLLQTVTINDFPIQWIDDDDDMQEGHWSGDLDSDCLMIDRNRDGEYGGPHDLIVDWNDEDGDGKTDMQVIADQLGLEENDFYPGHYMIMLDTDADQVFNYIDWDTFQVEAWEHSGTSRFFKDYHGHSLFLKAPLPTFAQEDLSLNWENPFLFYDPDEDGHTELAIRVLDTYIRKKSPKGDPLPKNKKKVTDEMRNIRYDGMIDLIAIGWDMDNDGAAGTEFDFDMSLQLLGKGFSYLDQVHTFQSMKGLEGTDDLFYDARFRQITELKYPDHETTWDLTFNKGEWNEAWFVFDEDDDCHRWERVEYYDPLETHRAGVRNAGLDDNPQADVAGDRGEWDLDFSGEGNLYVGRFDGKIHLYGAEWGAWRIDQDADYYQGWQGWRGGRDTVTTKFPLIRYEDTNKNGFIDLVQYDLDGNAVYEHQLDFQKLGINDEQTVITTKNMEYEDMEALFKKVARATWKRAFEAVEVAEAMGLETGWYANFKQAYSLREQYHFGYWLNFYLYMDMRDFAMRKKDELLLQRIDKAYASGNWKTMQIK